VDNLSYDLPGLAALICAVFWQISSRLTSIERRLDRLENNK